MSEITLDTRFAKTTIDRNIYGHFSEHLGRCIYEGYWVGEDSVKSPMCAASARMWLKRCARSKYR